ncbi:ABC transporter permease [Treponema pedis]|uniref:ABC transporter permease n=2 Tax=Treponema pedis TaxID=409322 RepID=S5ZZW2_9SPIR|nr:ABC transporter permease [Treponema pedis]AGT43908.1 ABC transporter permease [Treponema pedis str. T A4]QOW61752.1 ABC transporter permease [Treponema pedis]
MAKLNLKKSGLKNINLSENNFVISFSAVLLGLAAGAVFIAVLGNRPFTAFSYLFRGGLMNIERIGNTLATATILLFVGLSVSFAFKTGLFNIGASGQMLIGGLCATYIALNSSLPRPVLLIVLILAAIAGGALWGLFPGLLKALFNVHEVVSTIMMNWIAYWTAYYVIPWYLKGEMIETESRSIAEVNTLRAPWLSNLFQSEYINYGIFLAIAGMFFLKIILDKTTLGFELKAAGYNKSAAEYAGIKVNRNIIFSMMIAGAFAGLAGLTYYVGYSLNIQIGVLPSQGFDGIAVALLGAGNSIGVALSAIFFGILHVGKGFMSANTSVPPEIADTIIAVIIYFTATSLLLKRFWKKIQQRLYEKKLPSASIIKEKN